MGHGIIIFRLILVLGVISCQKKAIPSTLYTGTPGEKSPTGPKSPAVEMGAFGSKNSACIPSRFAAVSGEKGQQIMATIGSQTLRLECLNTMGSNATIYKLRGDPNPEYVFKIGHPTEASSLNYDLELALYTELKNTSIQPFLVETYPVSYTIRCRSFQGFKKRYVKGPTLSELGSYNLQNSEHKLIASQLELLYKTLKEVVESGHAISDIHDDNVIWDSSNKKLVIIDGHYDPEARLNFAAYFNEQCEKAWQWCKKVRDNLTKKPLKEAI